MSVTHREEVAMSESHYMRISNVRILVLFPRVMWRHPGFSGERELSYYIHHFLGQWVLRLSAAMVVIRGLLQLRLIRMAVYESIASFRLGMLSFVG